MDNQTIERPPLQPNDGKMLSPWKDNTDLRRALMRTADLAAALLKLERAFGDEDVYVDHSARWSWEKPYARINCDDEEKARKMVGRLIRALHVQPKMKKVADDAIHAHFELEGCDVVVDGFSCTWALAPRRIPCVARAMTSGSSRPASSMRAHP